MPSLLPIDPEAKAGIRILVVDDEHTIRESCASVLRMEGYDVTVCNRGKDAVDAVRRRPVDIAIIDLFMPEMSGMEVLTQSLEASPGLLAVVMTGNPSVASSLDVLRAGAWDYLPKPFSATHLQILMGRAAHAVLVARETEGDDVEPDDEAEAQGGAMLGRSPAFLRALELARRVAATDASVFITGESGSGKEMIAQLIHRHSRRKSRELVAVNCAALPENLLESEMFGHCKGAFTGAVRDKPGLLEVANGGTFFLDELTEMSQTIQAKLLRVIQDGVVRRVGSETTDAVVNVRFIAATNRDPHNEAEAGSLRRDLYYRLSVVPIRVPPLRERPEDIPLLAEHFLLLYWQRHRERGAPPPKLTPEAVQALQACSWRGNVRELQNVMEHAVVLLEPGSAIAASDLPLLGDDSTPRGVSAFVGPGAPENYHDAREQMLGEFEREYLTWLVDRAGANMSKAARIAGVDRTTLYRLMEKHGLQRDTVIRSDD